MSVSEIERLLDIMRRLRDPNGGCPWDLEQTFTTIAPYTIEEAYEVADAVEKQDMESLREELGDLLLQVVYHAQMASEEGSFDFAAVTRTIADKMVSRHPHVFGEADVKDAAAQTEAWEARKAEERAAKAREAGASASLLDDVPGALPALIGAEKLQKRAARVGFDWPETDQVLDKIEEEFGELRREIDQDADADRLEDEVGDLLFAVANLARHLRVDPEGALRRTNRKFERRFRFIERRLAGQQKSLVDASLEDMEGLWQEAKQDERPA